VEENVLHPWLHDCEYGDDLSSYFIPKVVAIYIIFLRVVPGLNSDEWSYLFSPQLLLSGVICVRQGRDQCASYNDCFKILKTRVYKYMSLRSVKNHHLTTKWRHRHDFGTLGVTKAKDSSTNDPSFIWFSLHIFNSLCLESMISQFPRLGHEGGTSL